MTTEAFTFWNYKSYRRKLKSQDHMIKELFDFKVIVIVISHI